MTFHPETSAHFGPRDFVAILRRRLRMILFTIGTVLAVTLAVLLLVSSKYTATTLLLVDPTQKNLLAPDEARQTSGITESARVESEIEIARSGAVMLATVEREGLASDAEFGPSVSTTDKLRAAIGLPMSEPPTGQALLNGTLRRLSEATDVRRRGLTYVFAISVTSESPDRAARLANAVAQTYIDLQIESKTRSLETARDLLLAQVNSARDRLAASNDAFGSYVENNMERLLEETGNQDLAALQNRLNALSSTRATLTASLESSQSAFDARNWDSLAESLQDEAVSALNQQRRDLETRLAGLESGSDAAFSLRQSLEQVETRLQASVAAPIQALRAEITNLDGRSDALGKEMRGVVLGSNLSATTIAYLYELQQEADIAQRQYTNLLSRLRDLDAQALVQVADARIVSAALAPNGPSFPKKRITLMMAFVVAIGLGVTLAFLNEFYIGGVISQNQLENILPIPVAATVPFLKQKREQISLADTILSAPLSAYSESFRRLRATIDRMVPAHDGRGILIMVCSANPSEGKTTGALSLARTYAQLGKSVALIDADLRKPTVHNYLGVEPEFGFFEYLKNPEGAPEGESFYVADPLSSTGVVVGRGRSDVPTDQLLMSREFQLLLKNAREAMDVIIVDTSPLNSVVDAQFIAPFADAAVICVRFGETSQRDLRLAHQRLVEGLRDDVPVVAVLNQEAGRMAAYDESGYYSY